MAKIKSMKYRPRSYMVFYQKSRRDFAPEIRRKRRRYFCANAGGARGLMLATAWECLVTGEL